MIERALIALFVAALPLRAAVAAETNGASDYPTNARADYVFGCMAANGQTREALERCSCSLDIIASILPYEHYVQAETVLMMRQGVGTAGFDVPQCQDVRRPRRRPAPGPGGGRDPLLPVSDR